MTWGGGVRYPGRLPVHGLEYLCALLSASTSSAFGVVLPGANGEVRARLRRVPARQCQRRRAAPRSRAGRSLCWSRWWRDVFCAVVSEYHCTVRGDDHALQDEASAAVGVAAGRPAEALVEHHLDRLRASRPVGNLRLGAPVAVSAGDQTLRSASSAFLKNAVRSAYMLSASFAIRSRTAGCFLTALALVGPSLPAVQRSPKATLLLDALIVLAVPTAGGHVLALCCRSWQSRSGAGGVCPTHQQTDFSRPFRRSANDEFPWGDRWGNTRAIHATPVTVDRCG